MKKWNNSLLLLLPLVAAGFVSCERIAEEPPVNQGYKTQIRMPDAEELTPADSAFIQAQQEEYDKNRNNI